MLPPLANRPMLYHESHLTAGHPSDIRKCSTRRTGLALGVQAPNQSGIMVISRVSSPMRYGETRCLVCLQTRRSDFERDKMIMSVFSTKDSRCIGLWSELSCVCAWLKLRRLIRGSSINSSNYRDRTAARIKNKARGGSYPFRVRVSIARRIPYYCKLISFIESPGPGRGPADSRNNRRMTICVSFRRGA